MFWLVLLVSPQRLWWWRSWTRTQRSARLWPRSASRPAPCWASSSCCCSSWPCWLWWSGSGTDRERRASRPPASPTPQPWTWPPPTTPCQVRAAPPPDVCTCESDWSLRELTCSSSSCRFCPELLRSFCSGSEAPDFPLRAFMFQSSFLTGDSLTLNWRHEAERCRHVSLYFYWFHSQRVTSELHKNMRKWQ